ncbi:hypothetical protein SRHO_G00315830 [Serrasalmus rhombeus]
MSALTGNTRAGLKCKSTRSNFQKRHGLFRRSNERLRAADTASRANTKRSAPGLKRSTQADGGEPRYCNGQKHKGAFWRRRSLASTEYCKEQTSVRANAHRAELSQQETEPFGEPASDCNHTARPSANTALTDTAHAAGAGRRDPGDKHSPKRYLCDRGPAKRYPTGPPPANKRPESSGQEEQHNSRKSRREEEKEEEGGRRCL